MSEETDFFAEIQESFLLEAIDLLDTVENLSLSLEKNPGDPEIYNNLARLAHNFKGSGKAVGFDHISKFAHKVEDFILAIKSNTILSERKNIDLLFECLDRLKEDIKQLRIDKNSTLDHSIYIDKIVSTIEGGSQVAVTESANLAIKQINEAPFSEPTPTPAFATIHELKKAQPPIHREIQKSDQTEYLRVAKSKIDYMLETFGEQVILQSMLDQNKYSLDNDPEMIVKTITQLTKLTLELQNHVLSLTMIPLTQTFTKLERAVRDAAKHCEKNIDVNIHGQNTEAGKPLVDALSDPLTHIVRNAVDHAIESEEDRLKLSKPAFGTINITAERSGGQLWLTISDDGRGLNPQKLKEKAIQKNLISDTAASKLSDSEAYNLIFAPGFSTKDVVSEISGRGVGMNVVSEVIKSLNGSVEIQSEINVGTKFILKVPLSLAIFNGAIIKVHGNRYVVPNSEISEICRIDPDSFSKVSSSNTAVKIRDEVFHLIDLRRIFQIHGQKLETSHRSEKKPRCLPVILSRKHGNNAFLVEEIEGIQKIVQKQVGEELRAHPGFVAGTILSDGTPGIVISLQNLIHSK
jgi:two-component system, chemotaxis family, sensor kinase CheA